MLSGLRRWVVFAVIALVAATVSGAAQQAGAPPPPAPKPFVPLSTTTLTANPDRYIGQNVTVTAAVSSVLSKSIFAIDQEAKQQLAGHAVLVVAPVLNAPVELSKYVTVAGELTTFDPATLAQKIKGYQMDLPPALVEQYRGHPVVIAKVVVNSAMVDLAMRLPPPYTANEQALDETMKKVGPAAATLRTAVDGSKADVTAQQLTVLKSAFVQTEAFWKARNIPAAVKIAQDAQGHVNAVEKAVAAGDWDAAKKSTASLNQTCGACHGTYRERYDDGSFRIKVGG
jgi:hypothetical protein